MNDSRTAPGPISRREFIRSLVVAGGSAAVVPPGRLDFEQPLVARPAAGSPNPNFVAGELIEVTSAYLTIHAPHETPPVIRVDLDSASSICRRGCGTDPFTLRLGDVVSARVRLGPQGSRIANWVQANGVGDWGRVVQSNAHLVAVAPYEGRSRSVARELLIDVYTKIFDDVAYGPEGVARLTPGDLVYYTGAGTTPGRMARDVWAYGIHKIRQYRTA